MRQEGDVSVESSRVWTHENGAEVHPDRLSRRFARLVELSGLPPVRLTACVTSPPPSRSVLCRTARLSPAREICPPCFNSASNGGMRPALPRI
ncbi:hypothetical protein OHT20_26795 [Streptomyces caniferus]|uniref:Uncharacterized protein n=1 Tax=Streptomyces caniferus TaxID=285557 RepID=A0A640SH71_9ACTN|nr:hypothetical protein [Streptomyces caniferus]GFE09736.1 hypothetical protein Scani_60040 [Streptomyces caniferus]